MARRKSKVIGFKAFYEADQDILDWRETMPEGERSRTLRDLIRGKIGATGNGRPFDPDVLARVYDDTAWIREALNDMPTYLERLLAQVHLSSPLMGDGQGANAAANPPDAMPRISSTEASRRKARMQQATW